jgi:two-component system NtrC family sensor kinase
LQGVKRRKTDIVQLVEASIKTLSKHDNVQISFTADISDHTVWVERERIVKALLDLEINAIEAMPEGGELSLRIEGGEDQVIITVKDTGRGISRENMDNLFIPFFSTKPVGEGTGLGLPRAYAAIRMHSGKIEVESNADPDNGPTGTLITITLPRGEEPRLDAARLIIHDD